MCDPLDSPSLSQSVDNIFVKHADAVCGDVVPVDAHDPIILSSGFQFCKEICAVLRIHDLEKCIRCEPSTKEANARPHLRAHQKVVSPLHEPKQGPLHVHCKYIQVYSRNEIGLTTNQDARSARRYCAHVVAGGGDTGGGLSIEEETTRNALLLEDELNLRPSIVVTWCHDWWGEEMIRITGSADRRSTSLYKRRKR